MTEVRCAECGKLVGKVSHRFRGWFNVRCLRCGHRTSYPDARERPPQRLRCACGKRIGDGAVHAGEAAFPCKSDKAIVTFTTRGPRLGQRRTVVEMVEERWQVFRVKQAERRVGVAAGLRFDVFQRDGFRCRYCGHGVEHGALLEADHVIPESAGGPTTLDNLVTACQDCNRGKSAKPLDRTA